MREIKFRAWDRINGMFRKQQMIKEPSLSRSDISKGCRINDIFKDDEFIWMQYTGLKDSNGVEIYEGDVVEMHFIGPLQRNVLKGIVVFLEGSWLVGNDAEKTASPLWSETNKVTIIGNIHENSELLEGE